MDPAIAGRDRSKNTVEQSLEFYDLQTQVTLRSSQRRARPAIANQGFNLLHFLVSGFHGHPGSGDIALYVSEHIARLVPLNDGEFSRG